MVDNPIPSNIALALCEEVRAKNARKKISLGKSMCWGCMKFSRNPQERCWANAEGGTNRGCSQVNKVHDKVYR